MVLLAATLSAVGLRLATSRAKLGPEMTQLGCLSKIDSKLSCKKHCPSVSKPLVVQATDCFSVSRGCSVLSVLVKP
jgi:hypothetical protein